jgi:KaiC/GvpD/RAD55 family RecA-like ATPase
MGDFAMPSQDQIGAFYQKHLPGGRREGAWLKGACPFCQPKNQQTSGELGVYLNPESLFHGYFSCFNGCSAGGFAPYFGRRLGLDPEKVPGFDPDRKDFAQEHEYPVRNLKKEIEQFMRLLGQEQLDWFAELGIGPQLLQTMQIGYNGRYHVYPYIMENDQCYAARCIRPGRTDDFFWHGNEVFFEGAYRIYNVAEIDRCQGGSLFITDSEDALLALKAIGFPGIAVPSAADLQLLNVERLGGVRHLLVAVNNSPEAQAAARELATHLGYKVRILKWPGGMARGYGMADLARAKGQKFRHTVLAMIKRASAFSPFRSPEREHQQLKQALEEERGRDLPGIRSGFVKMDQALQGLSGITILGGPPKAGKSCFSIQVATNVALSRSPVIYYDFENGRQKIYRRTLSRLSRLSDRQLRQTHLAEQTQSRLGTSQQSIASMLRYFRVVTDRKLTADIMRRHIDFIRHETGRQRVLIVVDSLHKLPFKNLSERRTGIDAWLRNLEALRDEFNAAFLVISELSRGAGGHYHDQPDLGSFKESGDIEYSADNAMILQPDWDPVDPISESERLNSLWMVASRENSPGKIGTYQLDYPYWGFKEC